jgi:hypothetical protein
MSRLTLRAFLLRCERAPGLITPLEEFYSAFQHTRKYEGTTIRTFGQQLFLAGFIRKNKAGELFVTDLAPPPPPHERAPRTTNIQRPS